MDPASCRRLAGVWLATGGTIHLVGINYLSSAATLSAIDWSPLWLSVIGILVALGFRLADMLTRLIGSFTILLISIVTIVSLAGLGSGGAIKYGSYEILDPSLGQIFLSLMGLSFTLQPPWWLLQAALRGSLRCLAMGTPEHECQE